MSSINIRVKELRTTLKMTQKKFGKIINVSQGNLSFLERKSKTFNNVYIERIKKEIPNVNVDWLKTGKGPMFEPSNPDEAVESMIKVIDKAVSEKNAKKILTALLETLMTEANVA